MMEMPIHGDKAEDVATVSNFRMVTVTKYHLDLSVNFDLKQIVGVCFIYWKAMQPVTDVTFDCHETMQVTKIENGKGTDLQFDIQPFTDYGTSLHIKLPSEVKSGEEFRLNIEYIATGGPGVIWLDPQQTAGKVRPYLYTQGQAVMNRSFFPCQDTPAVKAPYTATVKVPDGFTAIMSAPTSSYGKVTNIKGDKEVYHFEQPVPIQAYLVALAVGDLKSADIGPRSKVWTEPCLLERAQAEFDGVVEEFISTGEALFGPYVWGQYDILVMPPSFPFGGMENPCLTFVTPCLLVGDKSLTDVIIHEISHSWFGNLVTNANWSEFWLNEGFTMFAQRRIMEKIFGRPYTCLETATGLALLRQHIDDTGEDHPLNRLRVIIEAGVDPDDTYNETPYEKGFTFVCYLQHLVGDENTFDNFLKSYVDKFKYKSVVAEDTLGYFLEYFPKLKEQGVDKREGFEFEQWLNKPGWPPYVPDLSAGKELTDPVEELANQWIKNQNPSGDVTAWKTYQILHFLDKLLEQPRLPEGMLGSFASAHPSIVNSENAEILLRWTQMVVKNDHKDEFGKVSQFLESQGKQKYTLPVYKAMMRGSETSQNLARATYEKTKGQLHVQVQSYVERILGASK